MDKKKARTEEELVNTLNKASDAYYNDGKEIMSNFDWDELFDELTEVEKKTGHVLPDSPTHKVGANITIKNDSEKKRKITHEYPALSLAKSKSPADLIKWAEGKPVWLSWKLDGCTAVITINEAADGSSERTITVATRGNGYVGTDISFMREFIAGIPDHIQYPKKLVVRGEITIDTDDFEKINSELEEPYANPRNLAAGTLNLDNTPGNIAEIKKRCLTFRAFTLVYSEDYIDNYGERMDFLKEQGFNVVEHELVKIPDQIPEFIEKWTEKAEEITFPVDGLVITYDDSTISDGDENKLTSHHETKGGFAFKWADNVVETTMTDCFWSCSTNVITPVAIFDTVSLEGTEVNRASLCNISEIERLGISIGATIGVYKANLIIPKIAYANDNNGRKLPIPDTCPVCGAKTTIKIGADGQTKSLCCTNPDCIAKKLKKLERFCSKEAMDIDGLSLQTLTKFVDAGFIHKFTDIFHLDRYKTQIVNMAGFGKKSYDNIIAAVEKCRNTSPERLIKSLSIQGVGTDATKRICAKMGFDGMLHRLEEGIDFTDIDGIGDTTSATLIEWYNDNRQILLELLSEVNIEEKKSGSKLNGLTFVITGSVYKYKNRSEFEAYVVSEGGKVSGSVSKNTNYLVNNDTQSTSSKNAKAKSLNVPIISEEEFINMFG